MTAVPHRSRGVIQRLAIASGLVALAVAPAFATVNHPFASHPLAYTAGTIHPSHVGQATLDQATRDFYDAWKAQYLKQGCGAGRYYVATATRPGNLTVSEGHGYGMVLAALMAGHDPDAQTEFDGLFHYFRDHPTATHGHLMSWYQNTSCADAQGNDSATDGDLDIAFALLLADKQWGSCGAINYLAEAQQVIADVKDGEADASTRYPLLGDWATPGDATYYPSTRSSDFMLDHFRSYQAATGDTAWTGMIDRVYQIVDAIQTNYSPTTGLLSDFIKNPLASPQPVAPNFLEGPNDGAYDYNACRDPWRLATDYLVSGDARAKTAVQRINVWIRGATAGDPSTIKSGYKLNGTMSSGADYLSMAFVAPLGVGAMVDAANQGWLNAVWNTVVGTPITAEGYYENSLKLLAMIVMSGNWWAPEAVAGGPCVAPTLTPVPTATPTVTATPACPPTPRGDCAAATQPGTGSVDLKDRVPDDKDQLAWKLGKGAPATKADFGDPLGSTSYDVCVYDGSPALVLRAAAPAGGLCGGRACWSETASGFKYTSRDLAPNGLSKIGLKAGGDGSARLSVKGKGIPLDMPALPIGALPVTVQLERRDGGCWSATYSSNVPINQSDRFKAKSD
jgi:endo-1,4-beta-D-glucanase Y